MWDFPGGPVVGQIYIDIQIYRQIDGEGNGNPLQYACLGNLMHSGAL